MGATTLIDIIGSTVVGSMLLLLLIRLNANSTENMFTFSGDTRIQNTLISFVEILENDFKRIGYCEDQVQVMTNTTPFISFADSATITFRADLQTSVSSPRGNGTYDVITYSSGQITDSEVIDTPNPRDIPLIRTVNGSVDRQVMGLTKLRFKYFDLKGVDLGNTVTNTAQINRIEIDLIVEDPYGYGANSDQVFSKTFWQQIRLSAKNVIRRSAPSIP